MFGRQRSSGHGGWWNPLEKWGALIDPSLDKVWKNWVDLKRREFRDLVGLIADPSVKKGIKARALVVLYCPDRDHCPVYWPNDGDNSRVMADRDLDLSGLAPELVKLAIDMTIRYLIGANLRVAKVDKDAKDLVYVFQSCICPLLRVASETDVDKLLDLFDLNDTEPWMNMDFSSGYNPYIRLMYDKEVTLELKRKADAKMREIVLSEAQGKFKPRVDWEDAVKCYSRFLTTQTYGKEEHYSSELYVSQWDFLLDVALKFGCDLDIQIYNIARISHRIGIAAVVSKLLRYMAARPEDELQSCSEDAVGALLAIQREYEAAGEAAPAKVLASIEAGKAAIEKSAAASRRAQTRETAVEGAIRS